MRRRSPAESDSYFESEVVLDGDFDSDELVAAESDFEASVFVSPVFEPSDFELLAEPLPLA
jgi:hypothetical protein